MARVVIIESLKDETLKKFKKESKTVFKLMYSLRENPQKEKTLGSVGGILIKELKYKNFRFYFLTDGFHFKCLGEEDLTEILFRFVRMSDKKQQQKVIDEIKLVLTKIGPSGFV